MSTTTSVISFDQLHEACSPGGASVLTSVTPLEPAAGPHASVAPAKFSHKDEKDKKGKPVFAYERRFHEGLPVKVVLIDSKQSQNNRCEAALSAAIAAGDPLLARIPRIRLEYENGPTLTDLDLPHRAFDGQIRAGAIDGQSATKDSRYRALRDATVGDARALIETSPVTLIFGGWDALRKSHQGRYRSILVGEIIGILADQEGSAIENQSMRGGARIDPLGAQIDLSHKDLTAIADQQKEELSEKTYKTITGSRGKSAHLGLGGLPPTLGQLGGVTCRSIIRSHVLSFAALRNLRFGSATPEGDVACRMVLAALALDALARSDAELLLRANCDLVEAGPSVVTLDQRYGNKLELAPMTIAQADELFAKTLAYAEEHAGLQWQGVTLVVEGNRAVLAAAGDTDGEEDV
ncbi:type I-U CRISPR-associated protein Cas7 [Schaalia sp. 19OD2882]|uniref:type I-G CRISPR-associated RAMP protein Csb1/Cas7g n=1 Tax=Schaalia sp. 19OD2882 TaxID=2794089 RepID=UPI001C1F14B8|nr:type I-U CRISPR-associated RAMP protein Csb1/Cas7u [Schaalia sp. 19OD2882]QWW19376.1 type I-U CRISPR-associated protein Cas7 [Schaalia sp. 19OD2882]